jgi:hypothetical protein
MGIVARGQQQYVRQQLAGEGVNPRPEYATGTVHHDAVAPDGTVVHHHQVFEQGELVEWERDDAPGPWALVRHGAPTDPFAPVLPGPQEAAAASVRVGEDLLALPPLDDLASDAYRELPLVPDATTRLRFELTGSPVGPLALDLRYQNGRRAVAEVVDQWEDSVEGEPAHGAPEMHIVMTWRNYLRMRAGEATALEAIEEGGSVDARWTLLLLLHGLLQEPEYVAAYRSLPRIPAELGWWGEVAPWIPRRDEL